MATALVNGTIFTGEQWLSNHVLIIEGEKITAICNMNELPREIESTIDLEGKRLLPGLIDTQVNGGGGALFNDSPSVDAIKTIGAAHRQFGTTCGQCAGTWGTSGCRGECLQGRSTG